MTHPTKVFHRSVFLEGLAGQLEALLWTSPHPEPLFAAVVCHPHPLFGGTMHNKVVFRVARTLHGLGLAVLRFNFPGAGMSAGRHDHGRGEVEDVRAAIDFLAEQFPGRPVLLAGFSFGAWVGLRVGCADARVAELVGLGLPVNDSDFSFLRACSKPKLLIQGERDQYGRREKIEALVPGARGPAMAGPAEPPPDPTKLVFVPDADHFFTGKLAQVDRALDAWMRERHPQLKQTSSD